MSSEKQLVAGDQIIFQGTFQDDTGTVIDLTGKTVKFRFRIGSGNGKEESSAGGNPVIMSPPTDGIAQYTIDPADLTEGKLEYEWILLNNQSNPITVPNKFKKTVRPAIPTT